MSDWVSGSSRMKWLAGVTMATWLVGVSLALVAPYGGTTTGAAAAVLTVCAFSISAPLTVWAAWKLRGAGWLRTVWVLVAAGLMVDVAGATLVILGRLLSGSLASPFVGALAPTWFGYPFIIAGATYAALSMRDIPHFALAFRRAAVLPVVLYALLLFAMIGPGPAMPFSIGPRDPSAILRLTIDLFLVFSPGVYCVAASLQLPEAHRARTWLWFSIGALMWAMADVVIPLVDTRFGPVYPLMLWALGLHLIAMAASLTVDFHRASGGEPAAEKKSLEIPTAGDAAAAPQ